ncbi:MAG: gamma-glutamyltranspeptidase [Pseudomonadota bacterium]|jgi:gamma-glutamyltranspeptidase/glutathione hydrolase
MIPRTASRAFFLLMLLLHLAAGAAAAEKPSGAQADIAPEAATASTDKSLVKASKWMVSSANPLASEAGRQVLRDGGSAVDAAIAMQMVLALVEPQSSGLGGGAFIVSYDAKRRRISTIDGRETAPAAVTSQLFIKDGKPLGFADAVNSGLSVGVPGVLRALELAHQRHGRLPWARLLQPAIRLAEEGFAVSTRLHAQIKGNRDLAVQAAARAYFYPQDQAAPVGYLLKNPALAEVLRRVASEGVSAFYRGEIAQDIVHAVESHTRPGTLSEQDLAEYRALEREPVCSRYRQYQLCGMGPPSSGPIAVMQMLGMLQQHEVASMLPGSREAVHYFAETGRLAFADRERYVADPAFVSVPVTAMLDSRYLAWRGALIDARQSMGVAQAGDPSGMLKQRGEGDTVDQASTTHLVAIDAQGNAVSMTSTIESEFGSKIFVRGFLLNNQLTDFSLLPTDPQGRAVANRVEPRKRPRSSMSPIIVLKDDKPYLLIGSPGGSSIILYVAKTLMGVLDWKLDVQQAIALPNMGSRNRDTELEQGSGLESLQQALRQSGHRVSIAPSPSGVHAIMIQPDALFGGADPRREGVALGD